MSKVKTSQFGTDRRDWRLLGEKRTSQIPKERTKDLLKRRAVFKSKMGYPEAPSDNSLTPPPIIYSLPWTSYSCPTAPSLQDGEHPRPKNTYGVSGGDG